MIHYVGREVCESSLFLLFSLFCLAFIEREKVITSGQQAFDTRNKVCRYARDSGEISYLVAHRALRRDGFAMLFMTN